MLPVTAQVGIATFTVPLPLVIRLQRALLSSGLISEACPVGPGQSPRYAVHLPADVRPPLDSGLSDREMQVLRGMSQGKSNADIGRELYLSEDTVKTHARRLFRKLNVRDRAHAVHMGHVLGLLT